MGVEQEIDLIKYLSLPVDVLHTLQDDKDELYINRICHGIDVGLSN